MFPRNLRGRVIGMYCTLVVMALGSALGQGTGTIRGIVRDKSTKDHLPGAHVVVKGTSIGAATTLDGLYVLRNVPAGPQTLVATYIGYISSTFPVVVPEDGELQQEFLLTPTTIEGQEVVVTAQGQGQLQAINQQLTSDKIVSVVSESKIQELPDFNAAQAISRLPGVSTLSSSGEANKVVIRGLAPQYNQVAISGISLASTGSTQIGITSLAGGQISNDRSVDLTMVTPYMIKSISVFKTLTPDLNADAIGGVVNMELREAPDEFHTDLMWQSGYTDKTREYGNYRTILSASNRFFDGLLGVYLLGNAEKYDRASDNMVGSYNLPNTTVKPDGYKQVQVNTIGLTRHIETRKRYGGNAIIDYALPSGSIRSVNMFSRLDANVQEHQTLLHYTDASSANIDFSFRNNKTKTDLAVNTLEFENDFGFMSANIKVANTYSRNFLPPAPFYQFRQTGGIYTAGASMLDVLPENLVSRITYGGAARTYLNTVSLFSSDYKENDQVYKADFKVPVDLGFDVTGAIKAGGEFRHNFRRNTQGTPYLELRRGSATGTGGSSIANAVMDSLRAHFPVFYDSSAARFPAFNFSSLDKDLLASFLGDRFGGIMWATDPTMIDRMVDFTRFDPIFSAAEQSATNPGGWYDGAFQNLPNNYKYVEKYYAGYVMADLAIGPDLKVVGGVRFEQVRSLYEAFNLTDGRNPLTQNVYPVTVYPQNRFLLPMVQAKYQIADWLDVRYAYTQTLARPDYHQLSPHISITNDHLNVYAGNPRLVPAHSYNHDLQFTFHDNYVGFITLGAFYKTISQFTYFTTYKLHTTNVTPGLDSAGTYAIGGVAPSNGAILNSYFNSPYDAYVKGVEADIQMRFWYLPAPLDGIVLGINYTHIWSKATYPWRDDRTSINPLPPPAPRFLVKTIDSTRTGRLVFQPNDVLNAYIGYDYEGFSSRISVVFQGNSVSGIGNFAEQDGFTKDYFRVDASARQMLPVAGLQIFLDLNNLNARKNQAAQASIGGFTSEQNYGLTANLGIRFTL